MNRSIRVFIAAPLAIAATAGLIACGGGDSGSGGSATTSPATTGDSGGSATASDGKTIFVQNCGTCHTLAAAGTNGAVGPNLDGISDSQMQVYNQVLNGGGGMPSFDGVLTPAEIDTVSKYVADNSGK